VPSFKLKYSWVTISQGVKFSIFLLILAWDLQQCSATALPVIIENHTNKLELYRYEPSSKIPHVWATIYICCMYVSIVVMWSMNWELSHCGVWTESCQSHCVCCCCCRWKWCISSWLCFTMPSRRTSPAIRRCLTAQCNSSVSLDASRLTYNSDVFTSSTE